MDIICLATDYDGTLAHDGVVDPAANEALVRLQALGPQAAAGHGTGASVSRRRDSSRSHAIVASRNSLNPIEAHAFAEPFHRRRARDLRRERRPECSSNGPCRRMF